MFLRLPQTYGVTVEHATKPEIGLLKNKGVVGAKAGRCALFSACDVCRMFLHWNTVAPQAFKELAEGKVSWWLGDGGLFMMFDHHDIVVVPYEHLKHVSMCTLYYIHVL